MRIALFQHCRFSHIANLQLSPVTSFRFHAIFSKRGRRSLFPITNPYCVDPFSPTVTAKSHARFKRWRAGPHSLQILTRLGSRDSYAPWLRLNAIPPEALILLAASHRGTDVRLGARIVRLRVLFSYAQPSKHALSTQTLMPSAVSDLYNADICLVF